MMADFQLKMDEINDMIAEHVARKIELVTKQYTTILTERDREIEGLRNALKQSAKDFATLQEKINGN